MTSNTEEIKPWAEGPLEILKHGIEHSKLDTDFDARIAMISIDNAVELMIKTYLGLPNRITGLRLSRRKFEEISDNFTLLLDKFEELAPDKILGIELGDLEWYHRLRNQLYHQGNGIIVEKRKVEAYTEIAKILFLNLFEVPVKDEIIKKPLSLVGEFINNYATLEKNLQIIMKQHKLDKRFYSIRQMANFLLESGFFSKELYQELILINSFRNELIHGIKTPTVLDLENYNNLLKASLTKIENDT